MTSKPAEIAGIPCGALVEGGLADIACFNLEKAQTFTPEMVVSKSKNSPYFGRKLSGFAEHAFCGGKMVLENGAVLEKGTV